MTPEIESLFRDVDQAKPDMRATWAYLVNHDSGSKNKAAVDALQAFAAHTLKKCGFSVRFHEYEEAGNLLVAERGDMTKPFICLVGHLDTVFPDGEAAERPFTIRDGIVTGPGCLDMKGGITILLSAIRILAARGWDRHPVKILISGDEETAHRGSKAARDLVEEASGGFVGLNLDTGFADGSVVLGRKGYAVYRVEVSGVGAHAGNNPEDGRSAIIELAHKMIDINDLADHEAGTLINVGVMGGGTVPNAIPDKAWCTVDVRFTKAAEMERVKRAMAELETKRYIEGTETKAELKVDIPAMERTEASEALFARVNDLAVSCGQGFRCRRGCRRISLLFRFLRRNLLILPFRGQRHRIRFFPFAQHQCVEIDDTVQMRPAFEPHIEERPHIFRDRRCFLKVNRHRLVFSEMLLNSDPRRIVHRFRVHEERRGGERKREPLI